MIGLQASSIKPISARTALRFQLISAAALIAIIPVLLVGWMVYTTARDSLLSEMDSFNRMVMKQVQERTDTMLDAVDRAVMQHVWDDQLNVVLQEGRLEENAYELSQVMTTIISMETAIANADKVYLYVTGSGAVIGADGIVADGSETVFGQRLFAELAHNKQPYFWHDRLASDTVTGRDRIDGLSYARRLPASFEKPLGYFVVQIGERALSDIFRHMQLGKTGGMLAISPDGNVFADAHLAPFVQTNLEPQHMADILSLGRRSGESGGSDLLTIGKRNMYVFSLASPVSGWMYVSMVPYHELIGHIQFVKRIVIISCIALALLALAAALLLTTNIYSRVKAFIDLMQSENRKLEGQVKEALPERRAYWVRKWLQEPLEAEDETRLAMLGISVRERVYTAACIEWADYPKYGEQEVYALTNRLLQAAQISISRGMEGYVVRFGPDRIVAAIIQRIADGGEHGAIAEWAQALLLLAESELGQRLVVGIGDTTRSPRELHKSREEAERALQLRLTDSDGRLFTYNERASRSGPLVYPFEQEKQIMAHLKLGEAEQAGRVLQEFTRKLLVVNALSWPQVLQAFSMLLSAVMRSAFEGRGISPASLFDYNIYARMNEFKAVEDIERWIRGEVFASVLANGQALRESREGADETVGRILAYVRENYDKPLSLTLLADVLELPEAQLSQLFRKEAGLTFTDYVIALRMEKAKELLRTTDMKIADIAERMTYNNSQNFIRIFKKAVGATPGDYRKQYQQ